VREEAATAVVAAKEEEATRAVGAAKEEEAATAVVAAKEEEAATAVVAAKEEEAATAVVAAKEVRTDAQVRVVTAVVQVLQRVAQVETQVAESSAAERLARATVGAADSALERLATAAVGSVDLALAWTAQETRVVGVSVKVEWVEDMMAVEEATAAVETEELKVEVVTKEPEVSGAKAWDRAKD
jgi:hypothetical protein